MVSRLITLTLVLYLAFGCAEDRKSANAEVDADMPVALSSNPSQQIDINPTVDKGEAFGVYIAVDLNDCFAELDKMLPDTFIDHFKSSPEEDTISHHMSLGMWLRNNWGLWGGSKLAVWFHGHGIDHPDDMSGIILDSYWRRLNNKPLGFDKQVKFCQDYWREQDQQHVAREILDTLTKPEESYTTPQIAAPDPPKIKGNER